MWGNYPIADTNSFYQVYLQIISSAYSMFPIFQSIEDVILHSHIGGKCYANGVCILVRIPDPRS